MHVAAWITVVVAVGVAVLALVALRDVGGSAGSDVAPDPGAELESAAAAED